MENIKDEVFDIEENIQLAENEQVDDLEEIDG